MKITRRNLKNLIESYISVPGEGLAPLHDTESRQAMDLEALSIAKEILTREGYGEHAKSLDDTSDDNMETINSLYNLAKAFDTTGMLTPVHDQAIEIMYNTHDDFKGQKFALDAGTKPLRQYDFSQFNNMFGHYNPAGVVDINTGKTVPSIAIQVSYKTYDHMDPNFKDTLEDVISSIEIPAHIVTKAYGNYILWKGKSEREDIYNDQASKFLFATEKLSDYIEDYVKDFLSKNYPNQNLTAFQITPVDSRLQDVIRRSADVDNLL
jgi:hypothetical protein